MNIEVVLVNDADEVIGTLEKNHAHIVGVLHRAVSVIIFNEKNEMLLQKRAATKYHSKGLWSNAACTHPYLYELPHAAATRRLQEEMGLKSKLDFLFKFKYHTPLDNGMIEHELDHVFVGITNDTPIINTDEVQDYKYVNLKNLENELQVNQAIFTPWFKILFNNYKNHYKL